MGGKTCYCPGCTWQSLCLTVGVNKYISQKEMLIFCVVPANNDFGNCEANDFGNSETQHGKQRSGWLEV